MPLPENFCSAPFFQLQTSKDNYCGPCPYTANLWRIKDFVNKKKLYSINLEDKSKLKKIIKKIKPKTIFHLATYGQPKKWKQNELSTINLNINLLKNILNHSVKFRSRILYMSSAAVYE